MVAQLPLAIDAVGTAFVFARFHGEGGLVKATQGNQRAGAAVIDSRAGIRGAAGGLVLRADAGQRGQGEVVGEVTGVLQHVVFAATTHECLAAAHRVQRIGVEVVGEDLADRFAQVLEAGVFEDVVVGDVPVQLEAVERVIRGGRRHGGVAEVLRIDITQLRNGVEEQAVTDDRAAGVDVGLL